jgi:N-acetylglucosamine transport system permease protein
MKKKKINLYKLFIYSALIALAVSIIVPVLWVFMASVKDNQEFYGNPWSLPKAIRWENFKEAVEIANMGEYFTNSIVVTALAIGILLLVSIPCAYALARFEFKGRKILSGIF